MEKLKQLYKKVYGAFPSAIEKIEGSGSNRAYYRLSNPDVSEKSVIGVVGQSRDENHAFIYLTEHFNLRKLPVPSIIAVDDDEMRYLQTDLGNRTLFDALAKGRAVGGRYTLA